MFRALSLALLLAAPAAAQTLPGHAAIDSCARQAMADKDAKGLTIAVIDDGQISYV